MGFNYKKFKKDIENGNIKFINQSYSPEIQKIVDNSKIAPITQATEKKQTSFLDFLGGIAQDIKNSASNLGLGLANGGLSFQKQLKDQMIVTQEREKKLFEETAQKFGLPISPAAQNAEKIIKGQENANANLSNIQNKNMEKIQQNIENSNTAVGKKVAELSTSIGQMLPGFIPGLGPVYFAGSAASQYTDEGLQRGMTKDEARNYGGVMGLVEGATETLGAWLTKGVGKALAKGNISKALKTYGLDIVENFAEEAIIEPISEVAASITGGKDTADFSNLGSRMLQSGIDGALISIITGGASAGIGSAKKLSDKIKNKQTITQTELQNTVKEVIDSGKVNVENEIKNSIQNVIKNDSSNQVINQKNNVINKQSIETNKTAENGNIEQNNAVLETKQENIVRNNETLQNQLENKENTMYNNVESDGEVNENSGGIESNDKRRVQELLALYERGQGDASTSGQKLSGTQTSTTIEEKQVKQGVIDYADKYAKKNLTNKEIELKNIINKLGGDVVFYEFGKENYYQGLANSNKFYIDSIGEEKIENVFYHEIIHFLRQNNNQIYKNEIQPIVDDIAADFNYQEAIFNYANSKDEVFDIRMLNGTRQQELAEEIVADYNATIYGTYVIDYGLPTTMKERLKNAMDKILYDNSQEDKIPEGPLKGIYDDVLPEKMKKDRKWATTVKRAEALDQQLIREIMKKNPEDYTYVQQSNAKQVENADLIIKNNGYKESIQMINNIFDSGMAINADNLALAQRLLQEASNRGDSKTVSELLPKVTQMGTELGQAVQSLSIIKRLSPTGQLKYLQSTLARMRNTETENITKKRFMSKAKKDSKIKQLSKLEITQEMTEKILNTNTKEELDNAISEVVNEIASKLPSTLFEKLDTWRYLSMLGNPRTHIRNFIGNTTMTGTRRIKDVFAASIEDVVYKINPNVMKERTKTLKKPTEFIKKYAEDQTKIAKSDLSGQSKYTMENAIQRAKKAFGTQGFGGFVQKLADKNSDLLELEDTLFKGVAYKKAFRDYLTANGMKTQEDIDNNPNLVANAREYATEEALKATFQQYSALASWINRLENKNAFSKVATGAIIPFKKTPINIAKTGASYSPLGLAKSITYDIYKLNTGKLTVPQFIDNIAQGLTGTSIMAIGIVLYNLGLVNPGSDDDKEGKYDKALGEQEYSVRIGDKTFTLDWLSPVSMPLFAGAEFAKSLTEGESDVESYSNMITSTLDPMMSMSVLQGINNAISSFEENKIQSIIENSITGYISQLFPTLGGQINKTIDPTVRTTSVSKDSNLSILERIIRTNMNKIPGLSYMLEPSTDVWGNEVKRPENVIERAVDNFLMPYNVKKDTTTNIDNELKKVYSETGKDEVIPTISLSKTITYGGEKYETNSETYTQFKKTYGQVSNSNLEKLFNTKTYKNADFEEKANLIDKVYEYARDEAKKEFLRTKGVNYTNRTKDKIKTYEENAIVDVIKDDISYQSAVYKREYPNKYITITQITNYDKYKEYDKEIKVIEEKYEGTGTKYSAQKKKEIISKINSYKLNIPQKAMLIRQYYSGFDDYNKQIVEYINKQKLSNVEKNAIYKELGFTVKDGRVAW